MKKLTGPDFSLGVELSTLPDGSMLLGHALGERVLVARRGETVFAIGARCTHYGAPLEQGLLDGDTVRCPWHHACFSLHTGEALRAPAFDPVSRWRVEIVRQTASGVQPTVFVREKLAPVAPQPVRAAVGQPKSVVIIGGGAAGNAAAEMLRHQGYTGRLVMLSADETLPCDRPNLSKGFLSGASSDAANLLRSEEFYKERNIDLHLSARVSAIDPTKRQVHMTGGGSHAYDALLLATGAEPIHLDLPGSNLPHVHYLRTLTDSRALVAGALQTKRAVVIGASFIGLEVAASLRARGIEVQVVGREKALMAKVLGPDVGNYLQKLHESHGVIFHLGTTATKIDAEAVTLESGERLPADLVVIGIGVRPALALADSAGLSMDRGVSVNAYLQTSAPGVFAAGDIARWPDRLTGQSIRVEHWVVAEQQGQIAALNILGGKHPFNHIPFFWTEQYDFSLAYVGHAEGWDSAVIAGSLEARDCTVTYTRNGQEQAQAFVGRDLDGLKAEHTFEQRIASGKGRALDPHLA